MMKNADRVTLAEILWLKGLWKKIFLYSQSTRLDFRYKRFAIGAYTYGKPRVLFGNSGAALAIGNYTSISKNVTVFLGGEHRTDWCTTYPFPELFPEAGRITGHPKTKGDVNIGNDVWIGYGATILSGVTVGHGAVIGAFSVVSQDVADYEIVAGNPARHIRFRFERNIIDRLLSVRWWDWDNRKVKRFIPLLLDTNVQGFLEAAEREQQRVKDGHQQKNRRT